MHEEKKGQAPEAGKANIDGGLLARPVSGIHLIHFYY
jgi:hypothetical protein